MDTGSRRISRANWNWWLFRYPFPFLSACLVLVGLWQLPAAWRAHQDLGKRGTFTVVSVDCARTCTYTGVFVAAGGSERRAPIALQASLSTHRVGDTVAAIDPGGGYVYPVGDPLWWLWLFIIVAGAGALTLWAWVMVSPRRRTWASGDTEP